MCIIFILFAHFSLLSDKSLVLENVRKMLTISKTPVLYIQFVVLYTW